MKTIIIALLTLASTIITAQNTITWVGGTPGKETKWNEAKNWSDHQIPDENSIVIIKQLNSGHNAQPVISEEVEVASIEIQANAMLTIVEEGNLLIDGEYIYTEGISIYGGKIVNEGIINLYNLATDLSQELLSKIQNSGFVFVDNQLRKGNEDVTDLKEQLANKN